MSKGDIILISFPFTDLSGQKVRPVLILRNDNRGDDCIVAFMTSGKSRIGRFDIKITKSARNGLKDDSVLKLNKIVTLNKKLATRHLGKLETSYFNRINKKLKRLFSL